MNVITYYMRARDSGTGGWVYWTTNDPTVTPSAATTSPNYTGTLSSTMIIFSYNTSLNQGFGGLVFKGYVATPTIFRKWPPTVGSNDPTKYGAIRFSTTWPYWLSPKPGGTSPSSFKVFPNASQLRMIRAEIVFKSTFDMVADALLFSGSAVQVT